MKTMIATGGTGGHIYPALALADILKNTEPDAEISFFGSSNRMEAQIIPERGYAFTGMEMTGMNGGLLRKAQSALSLWKAQGRCRKLLQKERPDICVGFGNYISVPLILAAHDLHIPTMIHEQNSSAGKANVLLAKYADAVVACYESCSSQFPAAKTRYYGNPDATVAAQCRRDPQLIRSYGLDPEQPLVLFMMGSLGSETVAKVIDEACPLFDPRLQLLIAHGQSNDYQFHTHSDGRIQIVPYVQGTRMLACADLAVTRAGATTMAELAAIGCPSVLIPSPYVPNNHQVHNAQELEKVQAAVMMEEKDLNAAGLAQEVNRLMADPALRSRMKENAKRIGKPEAAYQMIAWMKELSYHG